MSSVTLPAGRAKEDKINYIMSEIDFLANKKPDDDQKPKNKDDKKEKIIWSEPDEDKPLVKEVPFSLLSFLSKKPAAKAPAVTPKTALDKNKLKASRQEILKLIKRNENSRPEEKKPKQPDTGKGLFARLIEKLKRRSSHKEILIDYQQVFNQEKIKRSQLAKQVGLAAAQINLSARPAETSAKPAVRPPSAPKPVSPEVSSKAGNRDWVKPIVIAHPAVEKKPAATKPARFAEAPLKIAIEPKKSKDSFLSRFFKMIKDKIGALNQPKLGFPRISLTDFFKKFKLSIAKPALVKPVQSAHPVRPAGPVKPVREEKVGIKVPAKPLEPAEPVQIKEEPMEVLETNLIKGEIITFFDWHRKIIILINAILIPVFLVAVIYFGLIYYQKQNQAKIDEQVKKLSELAAEVKQAEAGLKEITDFQTRLKTVSQIFAKHIYWTNFFKFLEDNTIKDVYYGGFTGDTSGTYSLDALASRFSNISEQVDILKNSDKITDVQTIGGEFITGDAENKARVKFNLNLSILKNIFTE